MLGFYQQPRRKRSVPPSLAGPRGSGMVGFETDDPCEKSVRVQETRGVASVCGLDDGGGDQGTSREPQKGIDRGRRGECLHDLPAQRLTTAVNHPASRCPTRPGRCG